MRRYSAGSLEEEAGEEEEDMVVDEVVGYGGNDPGDVEDDEQGPRKFPRTG